MAFAAALLNSSVFPGCSIAIFSLALYFMLPFLLYLSSVGGFSWPQGVVLSPLFVFDAAKSELNFLCRGVLIPSPCLFL